MSRARTTLGKFKPVDVIISYFERKTILKSIIKSGVPYNHRDRSEIKRTRGNNTQMHCLVTKKNKESIIDLTDDELSTKPSLKVIYYSSINRNKSSKKGIREKNEETSTINEISELEIEKRKIALRKRAAEARKKEAEAEALEIANAKKKKRK
ncbi:unnamed protein product [Rhizophagus irregularis]|nr:unnamed protein product [Rhizophagus irregularis]